MQEKEKDNTSVKKEKAHILKAGTEDVSAFFSAQMRIRKDVDI